MLSRTSRRSRFSRKSQRTAPRNLDTNKQTVTQFRKMVETIVNKDPRSKHYSVYHNFDTTLLQ